MNPTTNNQEPLGGEKCKYPRCACDSRASCSVGRQAGAAGASEETKSAEVLGTCNTCSGSGVLGWGPDDYFNCPECATAASQVNSESEAGAAAPIPTGISAYRDQQGNLCSSYPHGHRIIDPALSDTGAAEAGDVKSWGERLPLCPDEHQVRAAMEAEIADLRAQLVELQQEFDKQNGDFHATALKLKDAEAAPQAQGEPVAWGNFKYDGTCVGLSQHPEDISRWANPRPLYLGPAAQADEVRDAARYRWLANRVLACDYGDNDAPGQQIGWRIRHDLLPVNGGRQPAFMFGASINEAIDAALRTTAADNQTKGE